MTEGSSFPPLGKTSLPPEDEESTIIGRIPASITSVGEKNRAYLIVLAGESVGAMFRVDDAETVLGRGSNARVRLNDEGISRKHCRLVQKGADVFIEDLGSANGTRVNEEPVGETRLLQDGDKIHVGSTTILKFTYHDQLEESFQQKMIEAALRDGLTKAYNKKYFLDRLEAELAYSKRHKASLSLVMFDVDHFKGVNDNYGHLAGDFVLARLAKITQQTIRTEDVLARYGGEEFGVICRASELSKAGVFAERLRVVIETCVFDYGGTRLPITVSLGVASTSEISVNTVPEFIQLADEALYMAKRSGRNRVVLRNAVPA